MNGSRDSSVALTTLKENSCKVNAAAITAIDIRKIQVCFCRGDHLLRFFVVVVVVPKTRDCEGPPVSPSLTPGGGCPLVGVPHSSVPLL